jgi:hypothetical protein
MTCITSIGNITGDWTTTSNIVYNGTSSNFSGYEICGYPLYVSENLPINKTKPKQMKYYRVKKETFLWDEGAIISTSKDSNNEYRAVDPIFNRLDDMTEYISANIIEADENKDFFERVYPVNLVTKTVYKAKEQAKEMLQKEYK